jgi:hypothetical protein
MTQAGITASDQVMAQYCELKLAGINTVFDSVTGLSVQLPLMHEIVKNVKGPPTYIFRSAAPQYGDLLCQAGLSKTDKSLFTWWDAIAQGKREPKDGTLTVLDTDKKPTASWSIVGALLTTLAVEGSEIGNPKLASVTATFNCVSYKRTK